MIRIPSSLRCFSSQSVSTNASGCAYSVGCVAIGKFPLALAPGKGFHDVLTRERRNSGERTPLACWRSHSAIANFRMTKIASASVTKKFVAAEGGEHTLQACAPQRDHFKIESTGYITPLLMTVSISEACAMSS